MATVTLTTPGRSNLNVADLNDLATGSYRVAVRVVLESVMETAMPVIWPSESVEPSALKVRLPPSRVTGVSLPPSSVTVRVRTGRTLGARLVVLVEEPFFGHLDSGLNVLLSWSGKDSRSSTVPSGQVYAWSSWSFLSEQPA